MVIDLNIHPMGAFITDVPSALSIIRLLKNIHPELKGVIVSNRPDRMWSKILSTGIGIESYPARRRHPTAGAGFDFEGIVIW